ncbi:hypothetical protein APY04_1832 [Hyphomicrobium sulfonivorans]|uniref:Uncharacterized protein n=1 Tax=Hyphomicrobium sulfonivorans TaxID=121290 RepID=A0A120CVV0_HYPSL|nr:hypothetical protein APY04_1832 [Hyphomicrobium sulfonivorans]
MDKKCSAVPRLDRSSGAKAAPKCSSCWFWRAGLLLALVALAVSWVVGKL